MLNFNLGVDNVNLDAQVATIPEPASLTLLGTGFIALAVALRRRSPSGGKARPV